MGSIVGWNVKRKKNQWTGSRTIEIIQSEQHEESKLKHKKQRKNKQMNKGSLRDLWDYNKDLTFV